MNMNMRKRVPIILVQCQPLPTAHLVYAVPSAARHQTPGHASHTAHWAWLLNTIHVFSCIIIRLITKYNSTGNRYFQRLNTLTITIKYLVSI